MSTYTTTDTGFPSAVYPGQFLTPPFLSEQMERSRLREDQIATARAAVRTITKTRKVRKPLQDRDCKYCGIRFTPRSSTQRYCTPKHQKIAEREWYETNTQEKECVWCGKVFHAKWVNSRRDYAVACSKSCGVRASHRDRYRASGDKQV